MATKPKRRNNNMPNLSNATPEAIVDWLGEVRKQMSELKKLEGFYKEGLKARIDEDTIEVIGEKFKAEIAHTVQARLDTEAVKAKMGQDWYDEHCKVIEFDTIRTSAL